LLELKKTKYPLGPELSGVWADPMNESISFTICILVIILKPDGSGLLCPEGEYSKKAEKCLVSIIVVNGSFGGVASPFTFPSSNEVRVASGDEGITYVGPDMAILGSQRRLVWLFPYSFGTEL
jgi:hypothetical protein